MWLDLLEAACKATSAAQVARHLGVSQTAISLLRSGRYQGGTARMEARILAAYGQISCPFLDRVITAEDCRTFAGPEVPTHSPFAIRHWEACQACPHATKTKERS